MSLLSFVALTIRLAVVVALVLSIMPKDARAEPVLRPALDVVGLFYGGGRPDTAVGAWPGVSLGYDLELEPVVLIPELTGSFGPYIGGTASYYRLKQNGFATRALAGMRAGFALGVEPSLFVRAGYGNVTVSAPYDSHDTLKDALAHGFAFQAGVGVDYRQSRTTTIGGELFYDFLTAGTTYDRSVDGQQFNRVEYRIVGHSVALGMTIGFWL